MSAGGEAYLKETIWIDDPVNGLRMEFSKALNNSMVDIQPRLTGEQLYVLRSIAVGAASASIVSGIVVGWWFVRMKRSFRHQYVFPGGQNTTTRNAKKNTNVGQSNYVADIFGLFQSQLAAHLSRCCLYERCRVQQLAVLPAGFEKVRKYQQHN